MKDMSSQEIVEGVVCPVPLRHDEKVVMGHGSGGRMTHDLMARAFYPLLGNPDLLRGDDAAVLSMPPSGSLAVCTDSHIVSPLFFPGGDIGRLAVCGTVNDLAMVGARPAALTAGFILEEGLALEVLERVLRSMQVAAEEAGVRVVAGDTKVVEKGKGDGLFINTAGVGWMPEGREVGGAMARPGDAVILSGPIGEHGIAVLAARGELALESSVRSDTAPLNRLVEAMFESCPEIHTLRDPTRGGLATTLNEIARQSGVAIHIEEAAIPIRPSVEAACEMLGFDPLYIANEGKLVAIVPEREAEDVLAAMKATRYGEEACRIGEVREAPAGRVLMRTGIGGTRVVDLLAGEMLPRIC
ncbi:MAG TPA: hydrogenase expression/formation protein HypE [Anaerolineales bacterium]|nr:hydrogenase expression/formation protein HypE [Anaerolineales bacterium]